MKKDLKKFIVWVDYGSEGWNIFDSKDTFEEAAQVFLERRADYPTIITEYIPVKLVPAKVEKIPETAYR